MLKRFFTAIVLIAIVLGLLFTLPVLPFAILTAAIILYGAYEWVRMMGVRAKARLFYLLIIVCTGIVSGLIDSPAILLTSIFWWLLAANQVIYFQPKQHISPMPGLMGGVFIFAPCWLALNILRILPHGQLWVLFAMLIVWANDIGAYLVGKTLGAKHLAKHVSPNKTWEGLVGGLLLAGIVSVFEASYLNFQNKAFFWYLALCLATAFIATVGDLYESMIKRKCDVKDSGAIFPGHGGLMDRIDGLVAGLPLFTFGILQLQLF